MPRPEYYNFKIYIFLFKFIIIIIGQNGKFGQNGMSGQKGKVHLGPNVSSSAHYRGCVVNGSGAMAAI